MKIKRFSTAFALFASTMLLVLSGGGAADVRGTGEAAARTFDVTITNITADQVFTPVLVASHREGVRLFDLGGAASVPLEMLAEGGATAPLAAALSAMADVHDVSQGGMPLPPGQSMTLTVDARGNFRHVSVAAMLIPTNDAFFALNGVEGPSGQGSKTFFSPAYDAGTEANDEMCAHIPGPPAVCMGEGFNPDRTGAEGYVHVHRGIHGAGDLVAETYDWRNPVARIVVQRSH